MAVTPRPGTFLQVMPGRGTTGTHTKQVTSKQEEGTDMTPDASEALARALSQTKDPFSDGDAIRWSRRDIKGGDRLHAAFRFGARWYVAPSAPYAAADFSFPDLCVILRRHDTSDIQLTQDWTPVRGNAEAPELVCGEPGVFVSSRPGGVRTYTCQRPTEHQGPHDHITAEGSRFGWS